MKLNGFLYYVLLLIAFVNCYFIYFSNGFSMGYAGSSTAVASLFLIFSLAVLITIFNASNIRSTMKNLLRVSFVISLVLFGFSVYGRVVDYGTANFLWRLTQTVVYFLMTINILVLAKDLHGRLKEMSSN